MGALACVSVLFGAAPAGLWVGMTDCMMTAWSMNNFRDFAASPGVSGVFV